MTKLDASVPPPRLPVRDRAGARDRLHGALSPMLTRLASERATGVLEREGGTLYLADGRVVHAESPAAPGLDVLLTARGPLDPDGWRDAVAATESRDGRTVSGTLVDSGHLPLGALELCHLGALYDAGFFALGPSSAPGRFRYGSAYAHRIGAVRPVPVAALERETLRRRALLHRIWPDPAIDTAVLARTEVRFPRRKLTARRIEVLELVDGRRTARDIALALGRPAFHTLVDLRRLAAAGLVVATPPLTDTGAAGSPATGSAGTGSTTGRAGTTDTSVGIAATPVGIAATPVDLVGTTAGTTYTTAGTTDTTVGTTDTTVGSADRSGTSHLAETARQHPDAEPGVAASARRPPSVPRQPSTSTYPSPSPSPRHARTTGTPAPAHGPAPAPAPAPAHGPRTASGPGAASAPAGPSRPPRFAEPDIALLKRLREALEAL